MQVLHQFKKEAGEFHEEMLLLNGNVYLANELHRWETLLNENFVNGEKVHILYGYCDGTKKYK
jgi:hypothetical protein